MKGKRWFFILLLVLFVVNASVFIVVHFFPYQEYIKKQLISFVESNYDVELNIGSIEVSDRQLQVSSLKAQDDRYELNVQNIYINYNLFKLIFSNLKLYTAVKSIAIIEPHLKLTVTTDDWVHQQNKSIEDVIAELTIPDLSGYFQSLSIIGGTFDFSFQRDNFSFHDTLTPINISVKNEEKTKVKLLIGEYAEINNQNNRAADESNKQQFILLTADLEKGRLNRADYEIRGFEVNGLAINGIEDLSFFIDLEGRVVGEEMVTSTGSYSLLNSSIMLEGEITDFMAMTLDYKITLPAIKYNVIENRLNVSTSELNIDDNLSSFEFVITDYFASNPSLSGRLQSSRLALDKYLENVSGTVDVDIDVSGIITSPDIKVSVSSKKLELYGEEVSELFVSANYYPDGTPIHLNQAVWQGNALQGRGVWSSEQGFTFNLSQNNIHFHKSGFEVTTDADVEIAFKNALHFKTTLKNGSIANEKLNLEGLSIDASLNDSILSFNLQGNRFISQTSGDLKSKIFTSQIEFKRFDLNEALLIKMPSLQVYPFITGQIGVDFDDGRLNLSTLLKMANVHSGNIEGSVWGEALYDSNMDRSSLNIKTIDASYNYESFDIQLKAKGSTKHLKTETFSINKELLTEVEVKAEKPFLSFLFDSKSERDANSNVINAAVKIKGEDVDVQRYLRYIMPYQTANHFTGKADVDISYNEGISGTVVGTALCFDNVGNFNNNLRFYSDNNHNSNSNSTVDAIENPITKKPFNIRFKNTLMTKEDEPIIIVKGETTLENGLNTNIEAEMKKTSLANILGNEGIAGDISSTFNFSNNQESLEAFLEVQGNDISFENILDLDNLEIRVKQSNELLTVEKLNATKKDMYSLQTSGALNYNLFRDINYPGNDAILIEFNGDLLRALSKSVSFLKSGKSIAEAAFKVSIKDEELSATEGYFNIDKGELAIQDQELSVSDIKIHMNIKDNELDITSCEGRVGDGKILIRNKIYNDENDFQIGMLNLGRFFIKTKGSGIPVHIPEITPPGTSGNVTIKGRNGDESEIIGPFDDIKIIADCHISNASITYPPNTENLFKIINVATERKSEEQSVHLPFTIDLMLTADQQVRYVTYPLNLLIVPSGYIHFKYVDGQWMPVDINLTSESGHFDFFGTTFSADYANVTGNYELDDYRVRGSFFKYAADGSIITLSVSNDPEESKESFLNSLIFNIESDNPDDRTILHVLSKVRYNRRLEDIPSSQQNALLQDEFLQIAGMGLTGAFVDPLISPIETRFRKILKVDSFAIKPGFMENIIRTYGYTEKNRDIDYEFEPENEFIRFGKDILLNNLSITVGKFLSRNIYVDYELLMQKPVDGVQVNELLVHHNVTFHYNLPFRMRLAYRFYLEPEKEDNSHEIFIRRGFTFW